MINIIIWALYLHIHESNTLVHHARLVHYVLTSNILLFALFGCPLCQCLKSVFVTVPEANIRKLVPVAQSAGIIAASELGNHLNLELIKI